MPDGAPSIRRDAGSDRTERLNTAIDRMLAGGPPPVLNDPELHDLLRLAVRLRDELPDDLPDPDFRLGLKQQLTTAGPIAVPRTRAASPARFPWVAAVSAIAAVVLAAVSVGSLGIWMGSDSDDSNRGANMAVLTTDQLTATMIGMSTITAASRSDTQPSTLDATVPVEPSSMTAILPSAAATVPAVPTSETRPATQLEATATVETAPATRTTETAATAEPTRGAALAGVPPVDNEHVEQGPKPAADGSSGTPASDVSYVLETALPDLGAEAYVYRFAPPREDPVTFVTEVTNALNFQGNVITDAPQGRTVYRLFDDDRGSFHWTPDTGAFTLAITEPGSGEAMPLDQVVQAVRDWLGGIGYPVDQLESDFRAEPTSDTSWRLDARYATMPEIGFGHPLGVTVYVNSDGSVTEATGYWLDVTRADTALLLPADDIWKAVSSGRGLWTGGGIVEAGGEFRADTMRVTYILTRGESGELVLQPVVETSGNFTTADGLSSARVSCFIQAARTTGESSP